MDHELRDSRSAILSPHRSRRSFDADQSHDASQSPCREPSAAREKDLLITSADKVTQILQSCRDNDLDALTALATSPGGFVDDGTRKTACKDR